MHPVFVAGLPIIALAFVATLFTNELPLRTKAFVDEDAGERMLTDTEQSAAEGAHPMHSQQSH